MNHKVNLFKRRIFNVSFILGLLNCSPLAWASVCKHKSDLSPLNGKVITVSTPEQLQRAVANLQAGTTVLIKPGVYVLQSTLSITQDDITLRGDGEFCQQTVLTGRGMDNAAHGGVVHGVWSNAKNLQISNLTIRDVYEHGIILNAGAQAPKIQSVQIIDTGTQLIKANPTEFARGVNDGIVENSYFAYTSRPASSDHGGGVGYTNGIDVHGGANWLIRNNRFENFHNPDSAKWWWNPVVLMWNGASGTTVEANVFINVDRAIALGLVDRSELSGRKRGDTDHRDGVIRNNMVVYAKGVFSRRRRRDSDAAIIVWDSPNTHVIHNTVLSNGNLYKSIEFRYNTTGARAENNLVDAPLGARNGGNFHPRDNVTVASPSMFVRPEKGDLRLVKGAIVIGHASPSELALKDSQGQARTGNKVDPGADEFY